MEINNKIIDKELKRLDQLIDMVNFEYNLFFKGDTDRPPAMNESLLKGIINKYRVYQITDPSLRNKYNNLVSKYFAFKSKWKLHKKAMDAGDESTEQIGLQIIEKLKAAGIKNPEQIRVLIYNKLCDLIEKGYSIKDFDITVKDNKIEVKVN